MDYTTDLGERTLYPLRFGDLGTFLPGDILPPSLYQYYRDVSGFRGCRSNVLVPRRATLDFNLGTSPFIELARTPTIDELNQLRVNANAIRVELVGETVKYNRLVFSIDS